MVETVLISIIYILCFALGGITIIAIALMIALLKLIGKSENQ